MPKGQPNKRYTPEFKIKVVETMHNEGLSFKETASLSLMDYLLSITDTKLHNKSDQDHS